MTRKFNLLFLNFFLIVLKGLDIVFIVHTSPPRDTLALPVKFFDFAMKHSFLDVFCA